MLWILTFTSFIFFAHGEEFLCLDECTCKTIEEVISCENGNRAELSLPPEDEKLIGFGILNLKNNSIVNLPEEEVLLEKFPDLKIIQLVQNRHFNCSSLPSYSNITISHDCVNIDEVVVYNPENLGEERNKKGPGFWITLLKHLADRYDKFDINVSAERLKALVKTLTEIFSNLAPSLQELMELIKKIKKFKQEI